MSQSYVPPVQNIEIDSDEEIRKKDEEIRKKNEEIKKKDKQLKEKDEELKEKDEELKKLLYDHEITSQLNRKNLYPRNPCSQSSIATVSNLLSLIDCTNKVKGQAAKSASPTDIYVLDMNSNFLYEGEHVKTIYMKTFISGMDRRSLRRRKLDGEMAYEYFVYLSKIKDILKLNICPYFVKVLGGNLNTPSDHIITLITSRLNPAIKLLYNNLSLLRDKIDKHDRKDITDKTPDEINNERKEKQQEADLTTQFEKYKEQIYYSFIRNMYYIYSNTDGRPSIEDPFDYKKHVFPTEKIEVSLDQANYGYFMTEGTPNTISLADYINNNLDSTSIDNFNILLFQLIVAFRAMNLAKLAHNDLHTGNILVETKEEKCCILTTDMKNDKVYAIKSPFRIRVYDFDRSYIQGYENPVIYQFDDYSAGNQFLHKRDLAKLISYFFVRFKQTNVRSILSYKQPKFLQNVADVLIDGQGQNTFDILSKFYMNSGNYLRKKVVEGININEVGRITNLDFSIFNRTWTDMLDKAYDLLPSYAKYDLTTNKGYICSSIRDFNVFYLYPQAFDNEGNINLRELEKIKSNVVKDICVGSETIPRQQNEANKKRRFTSWLPSFPGSFIDQG